MADIFQNVVLPIANAEDARSSCRAIRHFLNVGRLTAVHVIQKAGGAPDKASVEQREEVANRAFEIVREHFENADTKIVFDTKSANAIFDAADEIDATAIVFTPRGGSRWIRLLTGDVALNLITEGDRPIVVLPGREVPAAEEE